VPWTYDTGADREPPELQGRLKLALIFISYDLAVVRRISPGDGDVPGEGDELSNAEELYRAPKHPYTR
jgi:ABC-type oligopeptide transport system ATPase subunit